MVKLVSWKFVARPVFRPFLLGAEAHVLKWMLVVCIRSDSFNFLSLRDGSDKIALGSDDPSAVGGSGVRGSGGGGGSNEKQRAKVEATARASARAQNQVLAVSHAQLAHAKVFVSNNLCELRVIKVRYSLCNRLVTCARAG